MILNKAKELYKENKGTSKEVLKRTLLMEILEEELVEFLAPEKTRVCIEEVKEVDEDKFEESPLKVEK